MFCSHCGKSLVATDRFCGSCGATAVTNTRRECPGCKAEIRSGAQFCHECGTPLHVGPAAAHLIHNASTSADALVSHAGELTDRFKQRSTPGQRVSFSSAILLLILFFLPWAEVSCMGVNRTVSGYELASNGSGLLWLVPLAMVAALVVLYRVALSPKPVPNTAMSDNVVIAAGLVATATMFLTYVAAVSQAKRDPIFGAMAEAAVKLRFAGLLAVIAGVGVAVGGVMHRRLRNLPASISSRGSVEEHATRS